MNKIYVYFLKGMSYMVVRLAFIICDNALVINVSLTVEEKQVICFHVMVA